MPKQTENRLIKTHQAIIAKMVQSFILKSVGQPPEKILALYASFNRDWERRVRKVNERYEAPVLSYDVWEREWKDNGYHKYITIPVPKQLPKDEYDKLMAYKKELIRIVFIVEGKTDHQRQRREAVYKILFLKVRIRLWIKSLFTKKVVTPAFKMEAV